jgi:hypothetical protein
VAGALDLDLEKKHEKAKAKAIAKTWIDTGVLRTAKWTDARAGRDVQIVTVGEWINGDEAGL